MQLLITLRFYATSSFQICIFYLRGYSQASISRIVARVSKVLSSYLSVYINFSTEQQRRINKNTFYDLSNFPSIIGCIDCTNIRIANPGGNNGVLRPGPSRFSFVEITDMAGAGRYYQIFYARWIPHDLGLSFWLVTRNREFGVAMQRHCNYGVITTSYYITKLVSSAPEQEMC
ncbi:Putative nuclease HARBI1 [Ooceraea biroi]|uniref:Putative nuclease HARBI1 n=1 Tax=Ooceraea biroi TaxID=2015173 RepID=A0A026X1V5_OOCBI|nr:Putative nuclease HARBI1 [Ooceraea biroi]